MKTKLALLVLGSATVLGAATGSAGALFADRTQPNAQAAPETPRPNPLPSDAPNTPRPKASPLSPAVIRTWKATPKKVGLLPIEQMVIAPGAVGPIQTDMPKSAALATGYFIKGPNRNPMEYCGDRVREPLTWKKPYSEFMRLSTADNGDILSIYVTAPGPKTSAGHGIGTRWGDLKGSITEGPATSEVGLTPAFIYSPANKGWITFVFNVAPEKLTDDSTVDFIEVNKGRKPVFGVGGC